MRGVVIRAYQTPVSIEEIPKPSVGGRDLLIQVHAASVNPVDFKIRDGQRKLLLPYSLPLTMGNDLAGTVVEVGASVKGFKVGDAIYARLDKMRIGAMAEYAVVDESLAAFKPKNLSMIEAASLPVVALTAWQALFERAELKPGERVFIPAGSGGVGSVAIQLARAAGLWVATTTSTQNVEWVRKLGANQVVDYTHERFDEKLSGLDFVLDTLGGESLMRSFRTVRPGGKIVSIAGGPDFKLARESGLGLKIQAKLWLKGLNVRRAARRAGVEYEYLLMHPSGEQLEQIRTMVEAGKVHPVIDRVFPLEKAAEAFAHVESGRSKGKVILQIRD